MANSYEFEFLSGTSDEEWMLQMLPGVLALFATNQDEARFVGTGFLISSTGDFITARHVAEELLEYKVENYGKAHLAALMMGRSTGGLVLIKELSMDHYLDVRSDLATGKLAASHSSYNPNGVHFALSPDPLEAGEQALAVGNALIPGQTFASDELFTIGGGLVLIRERVAEVLDRGHNIKSPVFRLNCTIYGGMSGGPVFRTSTGEVAGICSSALASSLADDEPYSFCSSLEPLTRPFSDGSQVQWKP